MHTQQAHTHDCAGMGGGLGMGRVSAGLRSTGRLGVRAERGQVCLFERSEFADRAQPTEHRKGAAAGGPCRYPAHAQPATRATHNLRTKCTLPLINKA